MDSKTTAGYQKDLAYIHDAGFGDFARQAAPGVLDILHRSGITRGLVVDLGCGSGLWAKELVRAGYEVLGVDLSAAMIKIARQRVPEARFQTASFLQIKLPACAAVTAMGECFSYLFDTKNVKRELFQFFRCVYKALCRGGMFIFDIAEPGHVTGPMPRRNYSEGKDWAILLQTEEDKQAKTLTRRMTTFRKVGKFYRRGEEVHRLQLYEGAEIAEELRRTGFTVRLLRGYGKLRLYHARIGFLARKP